MTIKKSWTTKVPFFNFEIQRSKVLNPGAEIEIWRSGGYDPEEWRMEVKVPERITVVDENTIEVQRVMPVGSEAIDRKRIYTKEQINSSGVGQGNIREYEAAFFPERLYTFYWEPSLSHQARK